MKLPNTIIASSESCEILHSSITFDYLKIHAKLTKPQQFMRWLQGQRGPGSRQQLQDILRVPHLQGGRGQGDHWPIRSQYFSVSANHSPVFVGDGPLLSPWHGLQQGEGDDVSWMRQNMLTSLFTGAVCRVPRAGGGLPSWPGHLEQEVPQDAQGWEKGREHEEEISQTCV